MVSVNASSRAYNEAVYTAYGSARANLEVAISQAVEQAIANSIAETVALSGVSPETAQQAMAAAQTTIGSVGFASSVLGGSGAANLGLLPGNLQAANSDAAIRAANAINYQASAAVSTTAPGSTQPTTTATPPPTPVVVVYRG